jgi:UrcA family protein
MTISPRLLRRTLPIALVVGALTVLSAQANAAEPDEVTVSAPAVKTLGRDLQLAPIQEVTVTAHVDYNPVTLTTNSGVALLKDSVLEAARKACVSADPLDEDDGTCVRNAVENAKPQVTAAIQRARSAANG